MDLELHWLDQPLTRLYWTGLHVTGWKLIGYTGALMFGGRWLVQFIASKRAGKPVIPRLFWYMSVLGSLMTLSYFLFSAKQDSVGVLQNLFPAFTALYSLHRTSSTAAGSATRPATEAAPGCGLPWVESTVSRLSRGARALPRLAEEQPTDSRLYPVGATTRLRPGPVLPAVGRVDCQSTFARSAGFATFGRRAAD